MKDYHINLFFSDADQGYIANIPDLECCSAFEETRTEAFTEILNSKAGWLEVANEQNNKYPSPTTSLPSTSRWLEKVW